MDVEESIARANRVLPGTSLTGDSHGERWKAVIVAGQFVETEPERIWDFVALWGSHEDADLRTAVSTCVLQHLLEHHFEDYFPRVEQLALTDECFPDTFSLCARFGQSALPANSARLDDLLTRPYGPAAWL